MRNSTTLAIRHAENKYYSEQIKKSAKKPEELYKICKKILGRHQATPLPEHTNTGQHFFIEKIDKIQISIEDALLTLGDGVVNSIPSVVLDPDCHFSSFSEVSVNDVTKIIMFSSSSSCELDPVSIKFLKANVDTLAPGITSAVNIFLQNGIFTSNLKQALIRPLVKRNNLPPVLENCRPVTVSICLQMSS